MMVKEIPQHERTLFACEECGLRYEKREIARRCEAWCREHKSCNLEIIQYALPSEEKRPNV